MIIVFDKSDKKSFDRVKELVNAVLGNCTKSPCRVKLTAVICIDMNKIDLDKTEVHEDDAKQYCEVETDDRGIQAVFYKDQRQDRRKCQCKIGLQSPYSRI